MSPGLPGALLSVPSHPPVHFQCHQASPASLSGASPVASSNTCTMLSGGARVPSPGSPSPVTLPKEKSQYPPSVPKRSHSPPPCVLRYVPPKNLAQCPGAPQCHPRAPTPTTATPPMSPGRSVPLPSVLGPPVPPSRVPSAATVATPIRLSVPRDIPVTPLCPTPRPPASPGPARTPPGVPSRAQCPRVPTPPRAVPSAPPHRGAGAAPNSAARGRKEPAQLPQYSPAPPPVLPPVRPPVRPPVLPPVLPPVRPFTAPSVPSTTPSVAPHLPALTPAPPGTAQRRLAPPPLPPVPTKAFPVRPGIVHYHPQCPL